MAANARHRNRITQRGFTACENALLFDATLSPGGLRLLLTLKHYAWKNDGEIPTQVEIAAAIGTTDRSVRDDFKELEQQGRIKVERRQGLRSIVHIEDVTTPEDSSGVGAEGGAEDSSGEHRQILPVSTPPLTRERDQDLKTESDKSLSSVGPDSVYSALLRALYPEGAKLTKGEIRKVALAAENIKTADGKPEQVARAVSAWSKVFRTAQITAWAVSSHWTRLLAESDGNKPAVATGPVPETCLECGLGGGAHLLDCPAAPAPVVDVLADLFRASFEGAH